ncbi:hypothetical protein EIP91_000554 [Steccherinum ochraceum]|uniref:Tethering factor for nuclear proteasome STS1 n=1 Tax=Steccherinum ochraceum TaxID=92696 RepID=A0A4R0RFT9_9APHY|nr:hypothetical protein EIP91_000554 [Steccherinum ochraceum]
MANVVPHPHPQVPPHPNLMSHSPSLGFGFGMSSSPSVVSWPASPQAFSPAGNQAAPVRSGKRRLEHDDEDSENAPRHSRDEAMDRSPTPERPKRAAPKRARTTPALATLSRDEKNDKNGGARDGNDVDVGVLLATLPRESLLPLMTSMLTSQPSLKSLLLSLIPRPSLDTATQAIAQAAKKLLDAYPYSNGMGGPTASSSFGFGSGSGSGNIGGGQSTAGFGFGRPTSFSSQAMAPQSGGMRDEYIRSRLSPHISEYVSVCFSYLPYFSNLSLSSEAGQSQSGTHSHASALQSQHRDRSHPSETFLFLHAIVSGVLSQPPLTRASLVPMLLPRLRDEWIAWIGRVDEVVNRQGGMFGQDTVRTWERGLDEFAQAKGNGLEVMREARDLWVAKSSAFDTGRAAGRAFTRTAHEYHSSAGASNAAAVSSRRRERVASGHSATIPLRSMTGSSTGYPKAHSHAQSPRTGENSTLGRSHSMQYRRKTAYARSFQSDASSSPSTRRRRRAKSPARTASLLQTIVPVNVETLSDFDVTYVDPVRDPMLPYQDDPPWTDISEGSQGELGTTVSGSDVVWTPHFTLHTPTSVNEHYQNLLRLVSRDPPPELSELIDYHEQYPTLQSTRSFNYLISRSIQHATHKQTRRLFSLMQAQGFSDNVETRALRARFLVRQDLWDAAWQADTAAPGTMPLSVWLEFFKSPQRRAKIVPEPVAQENEPGVTQVEHVSEAGAEEVLEASVEEDSKVATADDHDSRWEESISQLDENIDAKSDPERNAALLAFLMQHLPSATSKQWARIPDRVAHAIVSLLLRSDRWDFAESTTLTYFKTLGPHLDRRTCFRCLELIHLNMSRSRMHGLQEFYRRQNLLDRMLQVHPDFRPNSKSMFLLLAPLKTRVLHCGSIAWTTLQQFQAKWGPSIVDDRVRRRVADLAVKEGRSDVVEHMKTAQRHADNSRQLSAVEREVRGGPITDVPRRLSRPPERKLAAPQQLVVEKDRFQHMVRRHEKKRGHSPTDESS